MPVSDKQTKKQSKPTTATEEVASTSTAAAAATASEKKQSKPTSEGGSNKKKSEKPKEKAAPAPAPAPVEAAPAPAPSASVESASASAPASVESAPASDESAVLQSMSQDFMTKLQKLSVQLAELKSEYRTLEKKWSRELKAAQKSRGKRVHKSDGTRPPSGFIKPTKISDELAVFLNKPLGTEMSRTQVTSEINQYIKSNKLTDPSHGRIIIPDEKLSTLLKISPDAQEQLSYFNLQKYMKHHFHKHIPAAATAAAVTA